MYEIQVGRAAIKTNVLLAAGIVGLLGVVCGDYLLFDPVAGVVLLVTGSFYFFGRDHCSTIL